MILCANPKAQYLSEKSAIDEAFLRVADAGRYINGPEVAAFESELAEYCGVTHGVGVGSGTEALHLALRALGIGAGDEVITVSHTAVATVAAIELAGATPVLVDVTPKAMTIDPSAVEAAIGPRTRAIIAVHLYGTPAPLDALLPLAREKGVALIEDAAQAHGARFDGRRVGSFGVTTCFSFYPTKNLGAIGDGGMLVTNDAALAASARELREYGWRDRYISAVPGWNTRLDELQAAILRVKLRSLDRDNARRRALAARYGELLAGLPLTLPAASGRMEPVHHLYVVRTPLRDALQQHLREQDIQTLVHYPAPVHLQPAYAGRVKALPMPVTEAVAREVLSLPMYPELPIGDVERVADATRGFFAERR